MTKVGKSGYFGLAVLIFTPLFVKYPLFSLPGVPTPFRLDDFFFLFIILTWLIWLLERHVNPLRSNPLNWPIAFFLYSLLLSTGFGILQQTISLTSGVLFFIRNLEYFLIYYLVFSTFRSTMLPKYLRVIFSLGLIVVVISLLQMAGIVPQNLSEGSTRFATFSASYDYGTYFLMLTMLVYPFIFLLKKRRATFIALFIVLTLALLNADSRVSLGSFGMMLVISALFLMNWISWLIAAGIFAAVPLLAFSSKIQKFLSYFSRPEGFFTAVWHDPSLGIRLSNWSKILGAWTQHPILGGGLSSFLSFVTIYSLPGTPDNWYFRTLSEGGLLGLLTFFILIGGIIYLNWQLSRSANSPLIRAFGFGCLFVTISLLFNAFFLDVFVAAKVGFFFWALIGMAAKTFAEQSSTDFHSV